MFLPEMKWFYGVFSGKDRPVSEDVAVMNFDGMVWVDQGKSRGCRVKILLSTCCTGSVLIFWIVQVASEGGRIGRRSQEVPEEGDASPGKGAISVESDHGPSRGGQGSSVARVFSTPRTVWG